MCVCVCIQTQFKLIMVVKADLLSGQSKKQIIEKIKLNFTTAPILSNELTTKYFVE